MNKLPQILLLTVLLISPVSAITYDIVCNVDGAKCYVDGKYIGEIFANHLYYKMEFDQNDPIKTLSVVGENGSAEVQLHDDAWNEFLTKRIVVSIESGIYPPMGTLNIQTEPTGATIYFQDNYLEKGSYKKIGVTKEDDPVVLTTFQGFHRIKIWLDGYEPVWDRIYIYGDETFDDCYFLKHVGEHSNPPDLGPDPTPVPTPTPTPEIIIEEKEVIKEVKVIETVEVEVIPSAWVAIGSLIVGGGLGLVLYHNRSKLPKISLPKKKKKRKKSSNDFWDD